ncbi:hypothetical protein ACE38W_00455 [Chitinophaga sp. Hz27]|uniref:hypothetical protein n=1 Tax=Chitinophaga sp. Hz27 TaxID=3347169 RepID=UPI0035DA77E1
MVKINKQFKATVIAYGNSGLPLGQREDLDDLAIIALRSQDPTLLRLFDNLPSLEVLLKQKTEKALSQLRPILLNDGSKNENESTDIRDDDFAAVKNKSEEEPSGE